MKKKMPRPKRLVAECADEFHAAVNKHSRRHEYKSAGAFIIAAVTKLMAEQKSEEIRPIKE